MDIVLILCAIAWFVIQIIMVVKFFQIASDIRKLRDDKTVELSQKSISSLGDILTNKLKVIETAKSIPQKETTLNIVRKHDISPKEHCVKNPIESQSGADQLENEVLGCIISNDIESAKYLLMTKKGMTLNQAVEYIENMEAK